MSRRNVVVFEKEGFTALGIYIYICEGRDKRETHRVWPSPSPKRRRGKMSRRNVVVFEKEGFTLRYIYIYMRVGESGRLIELGPARYLRKRRPVGKGLRWRRIKGAPQQLQSKRHM